MPGTLVHQTRTATSTDTGAVYRISASCTSPGTLPDAAIFLLEAVTAKDPKDDTIVRLCSPADFTTYTTDRDRAGLQGGYYRAGTYTFSYQDVGAANGAWQTLSARINELVNDYDAFLTAFLTRVEGVDTYYPTIDLSEKTARIDAYKARVAATATAEIARTDHQRTCRDVKALELSTLQTQLAQTQSDLAALRTVRTVVDVLSAAYPAAVSSVSTALVGALSAVSVSSATTIQMQSISNTLAAGQSGNELLVGYDTRLISEVQTPLAAYVGTLESRLSDLTQATSAAQGALAACDSEMSRLQGEVDEARRARDAALAAVREVCTDFVLLNADDGMFPSTLSMLLGSF